MRASLRQAVVLTKQQARRAWLHAQRLDARTPFGDGADATLKAVEHLGYVQIDTINVIERCHHHILYTRIPHYRREHLHQAQTVDKTVFEYWTHALSYMPTRDIAFSISVACAHRHYHRRRETTVKPADLRKVLSLITQAGRAHHPRYRRRRAGGEGSRLGKPQAVGKRALQLAFYRGRVTVSERSGC